jgi:hypothetical protein
VLDHAQYVPKLPLGGAFWLVRASAPFGLAAEGRAAKTIRTYTEAVRWFAADYLAGQAGRRPAQHWSSAAIAIAQLWSPLCREWREFARRRRRVLRYPQGGQVYDPRIGR